MATKPSITINVRAADTTYTTGPIIGQDTKDARTGANIQEGYKPDSPLGTQPVAAQSINFHDNETDLVAEWTLLGSNTPDTDAHIVETDSSGKADVNRMDYAVSRVTGPASTDAVIITAGVDAKGLQVIQDDGDYGAEFVGASGATFASARVTATDGEALLVTVSDDADGMKVEGEGGFGLRILMDETGGGDLGTHIFMEPSNVPPTTSPISAGMIWCEQINGRKYNRIGIGSTVPGYIRVANNSPCYARSAIINGFVLSGSKTDEVITGPFTYRTDFLPAAADTVQVKIWGQVSQDNSSTTVATLTVRDVTAADVPICTIQIATPNTGESGNSVHSCSFSDIYILPSGGARNFDLVWSGAAGASTGTFNGFVEINELPST